MTFVKGQSGNPGGQQKNKPFFEALRAEIAAAGEDHKALRVIARNLIALAQAPGNDALPSIIAIADRLDGKPTQDNSHTLSGEVRVVLRKMLEDENESGE